MIPKFNNQTVQLVYSLLVILLVPAAIAFNTLFLLNSIKRDNAAELNSKAAAVESAVEPQILNSLKDPALLNSSLKGLIQKTPEVLAAEVLKVNSKNDLEVIAGTDLVNSKMRDEIINKLAWVSNQPYSKQIYVTKDGKKERVLMLASPLVGAGNSKEGIINIYLSASTMDEMTQRTVNDALIILSITVVFTFLLLVNHLRFYETALLYSKLKEVDKMKDDFISIASHELRTPISALTSYASMLLDNKTIAEDSQAKKMIVGMTECATSLKVLVEDLLNISRIEQNRMEFEMSKNDLKEILEKVTNELSSQAENKKLVMRYEAYDKPLMIETDKNKTKEIFVNLVSNAIKYTPSGEVVVYHEVKDNFVRTFVKDTGVGISEEDKEKLFKKFSRVYNEKTKDVGGTGLGLWITRQMVEKMKGKISVESIENQGTQFVVTFPLVS